MSTAREEAIALLEAHGLEYSAEQLRRATEDPDAPPPGSEPPWLYVCENCGRLGPIADFQDECKPGWMHGRLWTVYPEKCSEPVAAAVRELLSEGD